MKRSVLLVFSLFLSSSFAMGQVWQQTFDSYANGVTNDPVTPAWSTTQPAGNPGGVKIFSTQSPGGGYHVFEISDTGVGIEGIWTSEVVDISSFTEVALQITLYSYNTNSSDYVKCYYKRNGGPETLFGELDGNAGLNIASAASAIVVGGPGATVQFVVHGQENTFGANRALAIDDVTITNINVLYSIASSSWSNGNTWSTGGYGGAACSCIPTQDSRVIIGNNQTVTIGAASATVAGITVENTGKLNWSASQDLTMARGGTIDINAGGVMTNIGFTANLIYNAYTYSLIVDGTMAMSNIDFNAGSQVTMSGAGTINTGEFLVADGSGKVITNNVTGLITLTTDVNFVNGTADNSFFVNNGNLTAAKVNYAGKNVTITNNGTLNATNGISVSAAGTGNSFTNNGVLTFSTFTINNTNFIFKNAGTTNQTSDFLNVNATSAFNNLNNGVWNFSGTAIANVRLFANNATNTFNYARAGAQTIITPQDAYYNLTVSGSGTKTTAASFAINGNLQIQNAQLAAGNDFTLAGDWTETGTGSFSKGTYKVTMNGVTDQTISNASATPLSFNNLILNKSTGNVILSSGTPTNITVGNVLTLTSGGLDINGNVLNITSSSTSAIARTNGFIKSETNSTPYANLIWSIGPAVNTYVFPFAKTSAAADYIPFTFQTTLAGVGVSGSVSVATYPTGTNNIPYPSGVTDVNTNYADNSANVVNRFWIIALAGYTTNPKATMTFTTTASETASISTLKAQRWNSVTSKWDPPLAGQSNTATSATVPNVTNFSPWTLVGNNTVLPIELVEFTAKLEEDNVLLSWKTASEFNNDFFTIEKSADANFFTSLKIIPGKGTTTSANTYSFTDTNPYHGKSYYRLKQTDFDGNSTYSEIQLIEYDQPSPARFQSYPNPSNGHELSLEIQGFDNGDIIPIKVSNLLGASVYENRLEANDQVTSSQLNFPQHLPAGIYFIQVGNLEPQKIVVN